MTIPPIVLDTVDKMKLGGYFDTVVAVLTERHAGTDNPRAGASYNLQDPMGNVMLHLSGGIGTEQQFAGWNRNVWAKNGMLLRNPDHRLSWQSLHWNTGLYPGGARNNRGFLKAISGFEWQEDECGVHYINWEMGWNSENEIRDMLEISSNPLWDELKPQFRAAAHAK